MKKKRKKLNKKKKKFFIWVSCYLAVFLITSLLTLSTMSWFSGSEWTDGEMYMGGPVYIDFVDDKGIKTSGADKLTTETPPGWEKLYPGMNIHFEAKAVLNNKSRPSSRPLMSVSTAVLRAKVMLEIIDNQGNSSNDIDQTSDPEAYGRIMYLYNSLWIQLKAKAIQKEANNPDPGYWIFLDRGTEQTLVESPDEKNQIINKKEEECFFYYVNATTYNSYKQGYLSKIDCIMEEVGLTEATNAVGFLNDAVVTVPPLAITNEYSECTVKFTIVFHALQAFFGHNDDNTEIVLSVENGYPRFNEAADEGLIIK